MSALIDSLTHIRRSALVVPLAVTGALALLFISEVSYRSANSSLNVLDQRDGIRQQVQSVLSGLVDAETGQRGYLLTGRKGYLQPFEWGASTVRKGLESMKGKYEADEVLQPIVADLVQRSAERLSILEETVRLYDEGKDESWRALLASNIGKEKMDAVREAAGALLDIESGRIEHQRERVADTLLLSRIGIGALAALSVAAFLMYLRQTAAVDAARTGLAVEVEAERARLEREVERRTAELTELTRHLHSAREDERHHLARELHDELGALLTAAKLDAARLKRSLGQAVPGAEERLAHLGATLDSGIALKRRIIEDLRPSSLSNLGLVEALRIQAREFATRIEAHVHTDLDPVTLPDSAQIAVYRLVQESLTNVGKYASAKEVTVRMKANGSTLVVSVQDDGKGFDTARATPSSHGLIGMRYRVEAHGGRLRVQSSPGAGTLVEATLPLPA